MYNMQKCVVCTYNVQYEKDNTTNQGHFYTRYMHRRRQVTYGCLHFMWRPVYISIYVCVNALLTLLPVSAAYPTCFPLTQFTCDNGRCININWRCDNGENPLLPLILLAPFFSSSLQLPPSFLLFYSFSPLYCVGVAFVWIDICFYGYHTIYVCIIHFWLFMCCMLLCVLYVCMFACLYWRHVSLCWQPHCHWLFVFRGLVCNVMFPVSSLCLPIGSVLQKRIVGTALMSWIVRTQPVSA